jgi:1-phosphofructokinase family hexose kinase
VIYTLTLHAAVDRVLRAPGFARGGLVRTELEALLAAGKGFNVSRNLAALGISSAAAGLVGQREAGLYEEAFDALGAETILETYPGPTRCNITLLDPEGGELHLRERGATVGADAARRLIGRMLPRITAGDLVAACGSLPAGVSVDLLGEAFSGVRGRGGEVLLDSSGDALRFPGGAGPDLLKVNGEELGEMTGARVGDLDGAVAAAREALLRGPELVVVTMGAAGAVAVSGEEAWHAACAPVEAVNTVGAGDAFTAGFIAGRAGGVPEALGLAVACGAAQAACQHIGRLERAAVERRREGVETRRL